MLDNNHEEPRWKTVYITNADHFFVTLSRY